MILSGEAKFVSKNSGTSKKGNAYTFVKFLDDEQDEFFTIFLDEEQSRMFDNFKRNDIINISISLTPGNKFFKLVDAVAID